MAPRKVRLRLVDMQQAIARIERVASGLTYAQYQVDELRRAAIERWIEVVSEASRHLTEAMRLAQPQIPWRAVADIGNHLRHGYAGVSDEILWNLVQVDLPVLKRAVEQLLLDTPEGG